MESKPDTDHRVVREQGKRKRRRKRRRSRRRRRRRRRRGRRIGGGWKELSE